MVISEFCYPSDGKKYMGRVKKKSTDVRVGQSNNNIGKENKSYSKEMKLIVGETQLY